MTNPATASSCDGGVDDNASAEDAGRVSGRPPAGVRVHVHVDVDVDVDEDEVSERSDRCQPGSPSKVASSASVGRFSATTPLNVVPSSRVVVIAINNWSLLAPAVVDDIGRGPTPHRIQLGGEM
jgi:hypothetical protein